MQTDINKGRKKMLQILQVLCKNCVMCELGRRAVEREGEPARDPHVFSNMQMSEFFVLGQNPGYDELVRDEPFVGAAGKNWDAEVQKHGLTRQEFYVGNTVKCWTKDNAKPSFQHVSMCSRFLRMEAGILRPKLIISLGAVAFSFLCPGHNYSDRLGKITDSEYGKVFAVYHPSPRNLIDQSRRADFEHQTKVLCGLIKRLRERSSIASAVP